MQNLRNKVAAVTGAASGLGRALALNLAKEGCHLALADVNEPELHATAAMIGSGVRVTTHRVDVADRSQVYKFAEDTVKEHGGVDIIINNAGVAVAETLENVPYEDFEWVFDINFWGVVYGCKAFLPYLRRRPEAYIVNISSINAMIPFANNGPYNAAKSAVMGFTETLIQELDGSAVQVACVLPGGIKTNIVRNARIITCANPAMSREEAVASFDSIVRTSADKAALTIISGMRQGKRRILIGLDARLMDIWKRLSPVRANLVTARIIRQMK